MCRSEQKANFCTKTFRIDKNTETVFTGSRVQKYSCRNVRVDDGTVAVAYPGVILENNRASGKTYLFSIIRFVLCRKVSRGEFHPQKRSFRFPIVII